MSRVEHVVTSGAGAAVVRLLENHGDGGRRAPRRHRERASFDTLVVDALASLPHARAGEGSTILHKLVCSDPRSTNFGYTQMLIGVVFALLLSMRYERRAGR